MQSIGPDDVDVDASIVEWQAGGTGDDKAEEKLRGGEAKVPRGGAPDKRVATTPPGKVTTTPRGVKKAPATAKKAPSASKPPAVVPPGQRPPVSTRPLWMSQLLYKTRNTGLKQIRANAQTILRHHDAFAGCLGWDAFAGQVVLFKEPSWHPHDRPAKGLRKKPTRPVPWDDDFNQLTATWLERLDRDPNMAGAGVSLPIHVVREAVRVVARTNAFHPVKDFLSAAAEGWDGQSRVETWLIRHAMVRDTPYVRAVSRAWLISAVARIFKPGCQADHVLIIEGAQRSGKTTLLRTLCGDRDWYLETNMELGSKDSLLAIRRKWIVELAELDSMNRGEASRLKAFFTMINDTYRRPYGHEDEDQPRQCVFAGTINHYEGYLKDSTGNGRYWPVRSYATASNRTRIDLLEAERAQLWGEATRLYKTGSAWHLTDPIIIAAATREQNLRRERDIWEGMTLNYLKKSNSGKNGVSVEEILSKVLDLPAAALKGRESVRVSAILQAAGYTKSRRRVNGKRVYKYFL